jgi:hypothetical protein
MGTENLAPLGLKPQTVQPVASRYTNYAIPAFQSHYTDYAIPAFQYLKNLNNVNCNV